MPRRKLTTLIIIGLILVIVSYALILQPAVQTWAGNHLMQLYSQIQIWLHPPQKVSFYASGPTAVSPYRTITAEPPLVKSATPTLAITPIPSAFMIYGGKYFSQHFKMNYCGPANLAMLLSYLNWVGTPDDIARVIKPFSKDKSVMPDEMLDFIRFSGLDGIVRVGGDLEMLKRLIANGYPVLVEKGPHFQEIQGNITWMGHYQVLNGYDDNNQVFTAQDSLIKADYPQPYVKLIEEWRSFNYTYIVAFQPEKRNEVLNLLGADADENTNYQRALRKAGEETLKLRGVDQFFAFYNYGSNLVSLRDFAGAAKAYDTAFALYDSLPENMSIRPYRILWYQIGPYFAYYYTGRYTDVIKKATLNSIEMVRDGMPALEESYYWRGMAEIQIGENQAAIDDFYTCLKYHSGFEVCLKALNDQGIYP